jgi:phosphatidylserine/phosphatidylglycerophosphate/cardiolipin synthase-like enzyme
MKAVVNRSGRALLILTLAGALGCSAFGDDPLDGANAGFPGGKADGALETGSPEALAVLALVNDPAVTFEELDDDARLHRTAAANIIDYRNGPDLVAGTADDERYDSLEELDAIRYVGPYALEQLLAYAILRGYLDQVAGRSAEVVFSPQPYHQSHNVRIAGIIDAAERSIDVAMYSFSDAGISEALERAVDRGVKVRFLFDTASEDRKLSGAALDNSKSGRLERIGINVRWVNKIMHHKLMIVDGPRDDAASAATATIVSGSGNWSWGAATRYDENTLFLTGYPELALRLQAEFNLLWEHSRDVVVDASLPYELSSYAIDQGAITDEADQHVWFTSDNFSVSGDTFRIAGRDTVSTELARAISGATESIQIASGHLRSRPISEALIAAATANPELDIQVYLDGQEYISEWYHGEQQRRLEACLAEASTDAQQRNCLDKGFYFGYQLGATTGAEVRYKLYSYRWHYSYAVQMHHKYLIIDGDELWTGSYNLSDNAEHNTFENMMVFEGAQFAALIAAYQANFEAIWNTGEGLLDDLVAEVETSESIPLVFEPMALTWDQVSELKSQIRDNCALINSEPFRTRPEDHHACPR